MLRTSLGVDSFTLKGIIHVECATGRITKLSRQIHFQEKTEHPAETNRLMPALNVGKTSAEQLFCPPGSVSCLSTLGRSNLWPRLMQRDRCRPLRAFLVSVPCLPIRFKKTVVYYGPRTTKLMGHNLFNASRLKNCKFAKPIYSLTLVSL